MCELSQCPGAWHTSEATRHVAADVQQCLNLTSVVELLGPENPMVKQGGTLPHVVAAKEHADETVEHP